MDRAILSERLERAKRHVVGGVRCVAHQLMVIADLERHGHDDTT
jgi:hypothetical protein